MEPILCTLPRRFAVVAVARMVAKARNCEVGGEVGYHIGHSRVISARYKPAKWTYFDLFFLIFGLSFIILLVKSVRLTFLQFPFFLCSISSIMDDDWKSIKMSFCIIEFKLLMLIRNQSRYSSCIIKLKS